LGKKKRRGQEFDIESPLAIELRRVMIRINRELDLERKRCIMITSSERGEGKSLFSLHFSQVLAHHMQKRILLIDGDMRRPVQHTIFQTGRGPGLADLLRDDDVGVRPCNTVLSNLDFLPAGHAGENPSKLLQEERVRAVFDKLKSEYDIVILDSTGPSTWCSPAARRGTSASGAWASCAAWGRTSSAWWPTTSPRCCPTTSTTSTTATDSACARTARAAESAPPISDMKEEDALGHPPLVYVK